MINWKKFDLKDLDNLPPDEKWSLFLDKKGRIFTTRFKRGEISIPYFYPTIEQVYGIEVNEEDIEYWAEANWPK